MELPSGACPAGDFLDALSDEDRTKFDVLFEYLGDHYRQFHNKEKFKKLEDSDGIFEFKRYQHRILCFFTPNKEIMLAFGLTKKDDQHRPADIQKAEKIRNWYFSQLEADK